MPWPSRAPKVAAPPFAPPLPPRLRVALSPRNAPPLGSTLPRLWLLRDVRVVAFGVVRVEALPPPPPELPLPFFPRVPVAFGAPVFVPVRCPPPFAFCRLVPPPLRFPVLPPREFDPTLLLGVARGITPVRFCARTCMQQMTGAMPAVRVW